MLGLTRQAINPIIAGAVPFDRTQPSYLFIPETHQFTTAVEILRDNDEIILSPNPGPVNKSNDRQCYETAVEQALELLRSTPLRKVVISRAIDIETRDVFLPRRLFHSLLRQNPQAYVFSVALPSGQTLVGASPELLVRKVGTSIVSNPLAGSARRRNGATDGASGSFNLLCFEKDRTEHRYVVEAVRESLAPYCATLSVPDEPSVISTPTILHLSTRVTGSLADPDISSLQLASALHPTPAVCGTPFDLAHEAISQLEGYSRGWYSGMVGWMDSHGDGEWVVTLRCGLVNGRHLRLYAGAGIVAGSQPEAEWEETSVKLRTMLNTFCQNAHCGSVATNTLG